MREDVARLLEIFDRQGILPHERIGLPAARQATEAAIRLQPPPVDLPEVENRRIPAPHGAIGIRVYRPSRSAAAPLVIYLHGGGWALGTLDTADGPCRDLARRTGRIVVSVAYRLAPEHRFPAGLEDALSAVSWLLEHAAEFGATPSDVALMGDSAGGNLAAATVAELASRDARLPSSLVLVYPVLARPDPLRFPSYAENRDAPVVSAHTMQWFWDQYLPSPPPASEDPRIAPYFTPHPERFPRTFIATAQLDPLRDEGLGFAARLRSAGVQVDSRAYPGAIHGFWWLGGLLGQAAEVSDDIAAFLDADSRRPGELPT